MQKCSEELEHQIKEDSNAPTEETNLKEETNDFQEGTTEAVNLDKCLDSSIDLELRALQDDLVALVCACVCYYN